MSRERISENYVYEMSEYSPDPSSHNVYGTLHLSDADALLTNSSNSSSLSPQTISTMITTTAENVTFTPERNIQEFLCLRILYKDIGDSRVRIWDFIILLPNVLFLIFLLFQVKTAIGKLKNTSSPIFLTFYGLVCLVVGISILRCIVAMTVNASITAGDDADKILWLILRFFLLATELSVVTFGLAFGHLDSKTSIRRVLFVTCFIALAYSITQGVLEFSQENIAFSHKHNQTEQNYDLFGHGGMVFWFTSSSFFFLIYSIIVILPYTSFKQKLPLPSKKAFYYYCALLAVLNLLQSIGSALLYYSVSSGMCIVDVTTYLYFSFFDALVYGTFLKEFFVNTSPSIPFSYRPQVDENVDEDTVSMPYQGPNPQKLDDGSGSYDSTHFDKQIGFSPSLNSVNVDYYQSYS